MNEVEQCAVRKTKSDAFVVVEKGKGKGRAGLGMGLLGGSDTSPIFCWLSGWGPRGGWVRSSDFRLAPWRGVQCCLCWPKLFLKYQNSRSSYFIRVGKNCFGTDKQTGRQTANINK